MARLPRGAARPAGAYAPGRLGWGPVARPIQRIPISAYRQQVSGVPLTGGQAQGTILASGALTLSVGPQGAGVMWYPASLTVSTTSGTSDSSVCNVYLGPAGYGVTLLGTINPGGYGVAAFALPTMAPGQYLIATWSGGNSGDTATLNVVGTMSALAPG
jgi:hypothetical protein